MDIDAVEIRAALLYRHSIVLPPETDARIAAVLARLGHSLRSADRDESGVTRYATTGFELTLAMSEGPFDRAALAGALNSRFASVRPNDYAVRAARHRAHALITLRPTGRLRMEDAVVAAHAILNVVLMAGRAEMVYWELTDTVFLPEEIPSGSPSVFPAMLVLRPEIRLGSCDPAGRRRYGFVAGHSEDWFGKPVLVEPTTHPLPETLAFVDLCLILRLRGEDLLGRDGVLQISEGFAVTVRHMPPGRVFPEGHIALSVQSRGQHTRVRAPGHVAPAAMRAPSAGPQPLHMKPEAPRPGRPSARS